MSVELLAIYRTALADLTVSEIELACTACLSECRFMPVPADIRGKLKERSAIALEVAAENEWAQAYEASDQYQPDIGHTGPHAWRRKPQITEAGNYAVGCIGGWGTIADTLTQNIGFVKRDFIAAYVRFDKAKQLAPGDIQGILSGVKYLPGGESE